MLGVGSFFRDSLYFCSLLTSEGVQYLIWKIWFISVWRMKAKAMAWLLTWFMIAQSTLNSYHSEAFVKTEVVGIIDLPEKMWKWKKGPKFPTAVQIVVFCRMHRNLLKTEHLGKKYIFQNIRRIDPIIIHNSPLLTSESC